jgi:hypothetical protein
VVLFCRPSNSAKYLRLHHVQRLDVLPPRAREQLSMVVVVLRGDLQQQQSVLKVLKH